MKRLLLHCAALLMLFPPPCGAHEAESPVPEAEAGTAPSGEHFPPEPGDAAPAPNAPDVPARPVPKEDAETAPQDPHWRGLVERLSAEGMDRERLEELFGGLNLPWSPVFAATKLQELFAPRLGSESRLKEAPATDVLPPPGYQPAAESGYAGARAFLARERALLAEAQKRYGVPPALIAAVLLLESDMGHEPGNRPAFYALASMAATRTLDEALSGLENCRMNPALEREAANAVRETSARAYKELHALIRYGETSGVDVLRLPGSVYGAVGLCQFMPTNIAAYGVDSAGRGMVDLFDTADAVHSVGNFLRENGFNPGAPVKKQLEALRRYNHSDSYAALALGMSLQLAGKPVPRELAPFFASWGGGKRRAWMPKTRPAYRLPALGSYGVR